jgi:hypothetical protein
VRRGGIRKHPLLEFFEKVVNLVRQHAPDAAIAFNSSPDDCADGAVRCLRELQFAKQVRSSGPP